MIRNILFDLGNVVIDIDIRKTLEAFGNILGGEADRRIEKEQPTLTSGSF